MAYDPASRVTQIGNWDATIKNVYFNDNLLKSQEEWTGDYGDNVHRTVTYDADGNRGNIIYPSGKNYSYGYYGRNDLWYVLDNLTGIYQAAYIYDVRYIDRGTSIGVSQHILTEYQTIIPARTFLLCCQESCKRGRWFAS